MSEKTKTLKVKHIAADGKGVLFALVDDGSVWRYDGDEWDELPTIEVVEESEEET